MVAIARPDAGPVPVDAELAREWAALADRTGAVPFSRPGWVEAWARAHDVAVEALVVRRHGRLTGLLPLVAGRRRAIVPADWHTPVVEAVAADDETLEVLGEALAVAGRVVDLSFVVDSGPTSRVIGAALAAGGFHLRRRSAMDSPYVDLGGSAASYFDGLDRRKRSELRRRRRRLEEAGSVAFEVHDGSEGLDGLLDEGFAVEAAGWKADTETAIVSAPATEALYREVARWASQERMLRLAFVRLDGRPIAFDYCLEAAGVHYLLKTGFDPGAKRFAPAMHLRAFMIERAFEEGLERYDFAGDADPWKMEWTSATRSIVRIDAYPPTLRGRTARLADRARRRARTALRRGAR